MGGTYYNKMGEDKDMKSDKIIKYMYKMFSTTKATEIIGLNNFKTSKVTDMAEMFYSSYATTLDLTSFDTSNVTNMTKMFQGAKVETLDLSSFDTSKVTKMSYMLSTCRSLTTIYASEKFVTDNVTSSGRMFYASNKLVGGAGTKYSVSHMDKTYARIDGGTNSPGYFTLKTN